MFYHVRYYHPEYAKDDKRLTKLLGKFVGHEQFLSEDAVNELIKTTPGIEMVDSTPVSGSSLDGKFWFVQLYDGQAIIPTRKVQEVLESGGTVSIISGPHDTEDKAWDSCDAAWEAPGRDED